MTIKLSTIQPTACPYHSTYHIVLTTSPRLQIFSDVASVVGTKSALRCQRHYLAVYVESAYAPTADPRTVLVRPADSSTSSLPIPGTLPPDAEVAMPGGQKFVLDTSFCGQLRGGEAALYIDRDDPANWGAPRSEADPNSRLNDIQGYMPLRGDFDVEHDNDAEQVIADIEFKEGEPPAETELKLKMLEIYNAKLDDRERRKAFLLERGLLNYKKVISAERRRPKEEREILAHMRPFARFLPAKDFDELVAGIITEVRLRKRIEKLKAHRTLGFRTIAEAEQYERDVKRANDQERIEKDKSVTTYLYSDGAGAAAAATPSSVRGSGRRGRRPAAKTTPSMSGTAARAARRAARAHSGPAKVLELEETSQHSVASAGGASPDSVSALCDHLGISQRQFELVRELVETALAEHGMDKSAVADAVVQSGESGVTSDVVNGVYDVVVSLQWPANLATDLMPGGAATEKPKAASALAAGSLSVTAPTLTSAVDQLARTMPPREEQQKAGL